MKLPISGDAKSYAILLGAGVAGVIVLTLFFKKQATDTGKALADVVAGVVSGNNAVTEGTVYEGAGILGTLGAAANSASGGILEGIGSRIGGAIYDVFHPYSLDPNQRKLSSSAPAVQPVDKPGSLRY